MIISANSRVLIESFEGLSLSAYQDQRGIWTIGYGHTGDVQPSDACTAQEADNILSSDLTTAETIVTKYVKPVLNQNQFDALVSLTFNIGGRNFLESTVLKKLNLTDDYKGAAGAIMMWNKVGDKVNSGLEKRRKAEQTLFLTVSL